MRCEIAASLLHDPKILFLDEPTIGLDAVSKIAVRQFIKKRNQEKGTTVILTTHDMQDIEALTQRILLIGKGQILLDGRLDELKHRFSDVKTLEIDYQGNEPHLPENVQLLQKDVGRLVLKLNPKEVSVAQLLSLLSNQVEITDLAVASITAEEMVAKLYQEYQI
jgi:ABC-2 type transport system ATP-binding protein